MGFRWVSTPNDHCLATCGRAREFVTLHAKTSAQWTTDAPKRPGRNEMGKATYRQARHRHPTRSVANRADRGWRVVYSTTINTLKSVIYKLFCFPLNRFKVVINTYRCPSSNVVSTSFGWSRSPSDRKYDKYFDYDFPSPSGSRPTLRAIRDSITV